MAAMEHMLGEINIEHTVVFSLWQTPKDPAKDPVPVPVSTIIPTNDDVNKIKPSINPAPGPTSQYLQPEEIVRPDPHICPILIPPNDYLLCQDHPEAFPNLNAPQQQSSLPSEH